MRHSPANASTIKIIGKTKYIPIKNKFNWFELRVREVGGHRFNPTKGEILTQQLLTNDGHFKNSNKRIKTITSILHF
jgi:hypothetical protein